MTPSIYRSRLGILGLGSLCCFLWASGLPAIKGGYALLDIPVGDIASQVLFAGWRFVLAGLFLLIAARVMRKPIFALNGRSWRQVTLLGFTQTAIQYVFFYVGLANATGVKSSIMNATGVFFSVLIAHFVYADDRLSGRKTLGCAVGLLGVAVVNLGSGGQLNFDSTFLGEGFVVIAAFVVAAASIYGKRLSATLDPLVMTGWQLFIGGVLLTGAGVAFGGRLDGFSLGAGALLLYMALLSSVAFSVWSLLLKYNPVSLIAPFNFLIPVFGIGLSGLFLGESVLRWSNGAALVLVCIGIWLVTRGGAMHRPLLAASALGRT